MIVKRNNNTFIVKRDSHYHYYTALVINGIRVTSWHRTTKQNIIQNFKY